MKRSASERGLRQEIKSKILFKKFSRGSQSSLIFYSNDYVKISNEKNESFGVYCGYESDKEVTVTGEYALITFHSDYSFEEKGFLLLFTAVPIGKWIWSHYYLEDSWLRIKKWLLHLI